MPPSPLSRDRDVRLLASLGAVLTGSGLAHAAVWLAQGLPSLAGPTSLRKPIVFGLSSGITTLSLAWLVAYLAPSLQKSRWTRVYAVTMALEIFLIDMQQWRGVASHFNFSSHLDEAIFTTMGALICVSVFAASALGLSLVRDRAVPSDVRAAFGLGTLLLVASSFIGAATAVHGSVAVQSHMGQPGVIGHAGLLKVPHAISLHALQTLPVLSWLLSALGVAEASRARAVLLAGLGHALLSAGALAQTLAGLPPTSPSPASLSLYVVGLALTVAPAVAAIASRDTRTLASDPS